MLVKEATVGSFFLGGGGGWVGGEGERPDVGFRR